MDVVFDTGSDWLAIEGSKCETCDGNTYDGDDSGVKVAHNISERTYGSVRIEGYEWQDDVCLSEALCINDFKFFLIYLQQGRSGFNGIKEPVDGILGMCRGKIPVNKLNYEAGPLYVENLKKQDITDMNIFSFYLADPDEVSFVDFNGFAKDRIKG